jgi:hypothetical protein
MLAGELIAHLCEISRKLASSTPAGGKAFEPPYTTLSVQRSFAVIRIGEVTPPAVTMKKVSCRKPAWSYCKIHELRWSTCTTAMLGKWPVRMRSGVIGYDRGRAVRSGRRHGPPVVTEELLASGRLAAPFAQRIKCPTRCSLVYPKELAGRPGVKAVIQWLREEAEKLIQTRLKATRAQAGCASLASHPICLWTHPRQPALVPASARHRHVAASSLWTEVTGMNRPEGAEAHLRHAAQSD